MSHRSRCIQGLHPLSVLMYMITLLLAATGCESERRASRQSNADQSSTDPSAGESDLAGEDRGADEAEGTEPTSCVYMNPFSSSVECRTYTGSAWTLSEAEDDCYAQQDSTFNPSGPCDFESIFGLCYSGESVSREVVLTFPGDDETRCAATQQGCEIFVQGRFEPSELCEDVIETGEYDGIGSGGSVFQPFELICLEDDPERCTWGAIGGCAPEGERFIDYASCDPVLTQRPYVPVPPSGFETPVDDPILQDESFLREVEWVRAQAESCGCVCCHSSNVAPRGASVWDTDQPGVWTDAFSPRGLAQGAGWIDSSTLGAFPESENNGFNRELTVMPTTDVERMARFFSGELARRGYSERDFEDAIPVGGPLYTQRIFEPSACERGEGVNTRGEVHWIGGRARYIYVLEEGSDNPSTPPNLDLPDGTLWRLNVDYRRERGLRSGINYGSIPEDTAQAFPTAEAPAELIEGRRYYLYVMQDIAIPITRCVFTYGEVETGVSGGTWGDECRSDDDCGAPSSLCSKAPGVEVGYCSARCARRSDCAQYDVPDDWGCNALNCEQEELTWCGPSAEIEESNGFLKACP